MASRSAWAAPALALGVSAAPSAHGRGPAPGSNGRLEQELGDLELGGETRARVHALLAAARQERRELRRLLHDAHQRLRTLLDAEEPNEYAVMAQADAIGALEAEARKQELHTTLAVRALLTREQLARLRPGESQSGELLHAPRS